MPIPFTCPHCHKRVKAPDQMAGKSALCPGCKKQITIPKPTAALFNDAPAPEDVEAAAAAALADEPKKEEVAAAKTIDFNCPFCDELVHLSAELAGKRSPCPECRRIIKVPELVKTEPKDWRKVEARGPSGARKPEQPAPEGAWGTATSAGTVSKQALLEAEVIPVQREPWTLRQKITRGVLAACALAFIAGGTMLFLNWRNNARENDAVKRTLDYVADAGKAKLNREGIASLHVSLGTYYLRTKKGEAAKEAREQFQKALNAVGQPAGNDLDVERDMVLIDLALAATELGGTQAEVDKGQRLKWTETMKLLGATLRAMRLEEMRREALRQVSRRLIDLGAADQVLGLAANVAPVGEDPSGERSELTAVAGIELLRAKQQPLAERALEQASPTAEEGAVPPPRKANVIALAIALGKQDPATFKGDEEEVAVGQAQGLALKGQMDLGRKIATAAQSNVNRFRALTALAYAASAGEAADVEAAMQLAENNLRGQREPGLDELRLTYVALKAGMDPQKLEGLAAAIVDPQLRGRAQLALLKARLAQTKGAAEESLADAVEERSLSRGLAREALARHNARADKSTAKTVADWREPFNVFGSIGAALGMQGD
jgi:hypothetical protein